MTLLWAGRPVDPDLLAVRGQQGSVSETGRGAKSSACERRKEVREAVEVVGDKALQIQQIRLRTKLRLFASV